MKPHRLFFPCLFLVSLPMAVSGQSKQAMTMIDLLNVPSLSDPQMASDGSQLLYVLGESDWEKSKQIRHIWRIEADGTNTLRMTSGGGRGRAVRGGHQTANGSPFSPNGRTTKALRSI